VTWKIFLNILFVHFILFYFILFKINVRKTRWPPTDGGTQKYTNIRSTEKYKKEHKQTNKTQK